MLTKQIITLYCLHINDSVRFNSLSIENNIWYIKGSGNIKNYTIYHNKQIIHIKKMNVTWFDCDVNFFIAHSIIFKLNYEPLFPLFWLFSDKLVSNKYYMFKVATDHIWIQIMNLDHVPLLKYPIWSICNGLHELITHWQCSNLREFYLTHPLMLT